MVLRKQAAARSAAAVVLLAHPKTGRPGLTLTVDSGADANRMDRRLRPSWRRPTGVAASP